MPLIIFIVLIVSLTVNGRVDHDNVLNGHMTQSRLICVATLFLAPTMLDAPS